MEADKDCYLILGVPETASDEEIKRAYRALAQRYHPDTRTEHAPTALFHELQAAYAVLGDPLRRRAYDRRRAEVQQSPTPSLSWDIVVSRSQLLAGCAEQMLYLLVEIRPERVERAKRLPLNLCLVIDRSTSMQGARLEGVKAAAHQIIGELSDDDALAVVTFSDRAEVVLPIQLGISRAIARAKVSTIQTSGGTEILSGLQAGLAELGNRHRSGVISHLLLLTDGQTYGDEEACIAEARRAGARGIAISAMGIGPDWNDAVLDEVAAQSGGTSAYIASPGQVRTILQQIVRGLGDVLAQRLSLVLHCAESVQVEGAFRVQPSIGRLATAEGAFALGALEANAPLVLAFELGVGPRTTGEQRLLQLELTADMSTPEASRAVLKRDLVCRFVPDEPPVEAAPASIVSAWSKITLCRMQERAWAALEAGDAKSATHRLQLVATRLLDMGENQLAQAALLEAGRIADGKDPTAEGRKQIKYGTRTLGVRAGGKWYGH